MGQAMAGMLFIKSSVGAEWDVKSSCRDAQDIEMTFIYFSAPESNSGAGIIHW